MDDNYETVRLDYTIHKFSSYSLNYLPQCIIKNSPADGYSRWFTDNPTPNQYLILKLKSSAIVETIKFGKFIKSHVSNLKKFQVLGGTDEGNLSVILQGGLKNNAEAETFKLRHKTQDGLYLPITFLKIVPLQSWGPAFNYSIWFVELMGRNQENLIDQALETINLRKEEEAVRILLKHLRRRRYKDAFEALSRESGVQLEGPIQSRLWNALVEKGDFELTEKIFTEATADGELDWYLSWQPYTAIWRQITPCSSQVEAKLSTPAMRPPAGARLGPQDLHSVDRDEPAEGPDENCGDVDMSECGPAGCCSKPGPRGGHQLVLDTTTGTLYLFGGWNGSEDLDDLWSFSTTQEQWRLLCPHSEEAGGPGPRSCHKMVFDPVNRRLFVLGRYLDNAQRIPDLMKSALYTYDVSTNEWSQSCADTAAAGGPRLVFDHQMCIDTDTQTIYVFGGRILPANTEEAANPQYSGLYAYYIATGTWQLLLPDKHSLPAPQSRVSHSMLFHPVQRRLYILAGQRHKQHLAELWAWDAGSGAARALCAAPAHHPPAGFTQRATLDPALDEIHVLAGMSKEKERRVYNTLWVFSLRGRAWSCVWSSAGPGGEPAPRPRFAHQLVYDSHKKIHYLFGGNPGTQSHPRVRLDDLWSLRLLRPSAEDVLKRARVAIRELCYKEMCGTDPKAALMYLRTKINEAVDHTDQTQVSNFHLLPSSLFSREGGTGASCALCPRRARALARRRADMRAHTDYSHHIKQVLGGIDETSFEPFRPFEETPTPEPETWDVGLDEEASCPEEWSSRNERITLYDELCTYFRPSTVPPESDVTQLVKL